MESQTFKGDLDSLAPIRRFVSGAAEKAGLDHRSNYELCLAVDEIASNVILHGYEEAGLKGNLRLRSAVTDTCLFIYLEDCGQAYDPDAYQMPTEEDLCEPLEARPIGGLGIYLARTGVSNLRYRQIGKHHVHQFVVHRKQDA